jgi:hypothetical protein
MPGKYDDQVPELRAMLERADATITYLQRKSTLSPQESFDLVSARHLLQSYELEQLKIRVDRLEDAVLLRREPTAGAEAEES